jgi:hypothetical protein
LILPWPTYSSALIFEMKEWNKINNEINVLELSEEEEQWP